MGNFAKSLLSVAAVFSLCSYALADEPENLGENQSASIEGQQVGESQNASLQEQNGGGNLDESDSTQSPLDNSAQSTDSSTSNVFDLGRIEKIDSNIGENASAGANTTVSVVTQQDIANTGATDIAEALRFSPGVFYQPASSQRGEPSINIRGYGTTQIGFFLDGVPVHSIYDRQTDWAQFSSFGISEIDISKGYTSPIYGMNTLGGAVNIITSKPTKELEVYARYGFVSNNENQLSLSLGTRLENWYMQVNYSYVDRDSLPLSRQYAGTAAQPSGDKLNSWYTNNTFRAKLGWENENHEYSLNVIYQKGEKGGLLSATGGNWWDWPAYDKLTAYLVGTSYFTPKLSLNTRIYYDSFYNVLESYGRYTGGETPTNMQFDSIYDDWSGGGILTLGYEFTRDINLKGGVNLRADTHVEKATNSSGVVERGDFVRDFSTSVFLEYNQRINSLFRYSINGSYDRNDILDAFVDGYNDKADSLQGWTLQGIVYLDLSDWATLHLNIGKKDKLPTIKDRYSSTWGYRVPNPNLQTESAINYEIGADFAYRNTTATAAVFFNDMNDMLVSESLPDSACSMGTDCYRLTNAKEGYSYGLELGIKQGFLDNAITLGANYSYIQKKAKAISSDYGVDGSKILNYPNHIFNVNAIFRPMDPLDIIFNTTFQSKQWYASNGVYAQNKDIFLIDLKVNYRVIENVQISVGAYNLLDKNYYYGTGYYQAGRRVFASVEYKY